MSEVLVKSPRREAFIDSVYHVRASTYRNARNMADGKMKAIIEANMDSMIMGVSLSVIKRQPKYGRIIVEKPGSKSKLNGKTYFQKYIRSFKKMHQEGTNAIFGNAPINMGRIIGSTVIHTLIRNSATFCGTLMTAREFITLANSAQFGKSAKDRGAYDAIISCDLLIIDRFGADGIHSSNSATVLLDAINERIGYGLPTIIFSSETVGVSASGIDNKYPGIVDLLSTTFNSYNVVLFEAAE